MIDSAARRGRGGAGETVSATAARSGPVPPGLQVFHLLGRERIQDDVEGGQLQAGDLDVDLLRNVVDALDEIPVLGGKVLGGEGRVESGGLACNPSRRS